MLCFTAESFKATRFDGTGRRSPARAMYDRKLSVPEVQHRIENYDLPYRETLRLGSGWNVDGHSMTSHGSAMSVEDGAARPDVVSGDRRGNTADAAHTACAAEWSRTRGCSWQVNDPDQGGDLVRSWGALAEQRQSIELEFNLALCMKELAFEREARLGEMCALCGDFFGASAAEASGAGR